MRCADAFISYICADVVRDVLEILPARYPVCTLGRTRLCLWQVAGEVCRIDVAYMVVVVLLA
jgi:hypothetical protein